MPHKYLPLDGIAVFLHHRGPTTLPDAPPDTRQGATVVCLHDAGSNGAAFDGVLDALAAEHSPLAFDQPGHARSGGLDSLGSVPRLAQLASALADKLGLAPALWLGEGLGAAIALELAQRSPTRVRGLVLCGASRHFERADEQLARLQPVVEGRARREFDAWGYGPDTPRAVYGRAFGEWLKTDPRATYGDWLALRDWRLDAAGIAAPALVVDGEGAPEAARSAARELAEALPAGRLATLAGAGTHPSLERPAELASLVSGFAAEPAA